jgi:hypothetical protein
MYILSLVYPRSTRGHVAFLKWVSYAFKDNIQKKINTTKEEKVGFLLDSITVCRSNGVRRKAL